MHKQDEKVFVFSWLSPLSYLYPAPFTVDGLTYNSALQYVNYQAAVKFGDEGSADRILQETHHDEKTSIQIYNDDEFFSIVKHFVFTAAAHKFSCNAELKCLLLDTGDLHLGCATTNRFFGTGVDFDNTYALKTNRWRGSNQLGKTLMIVRECFRRNEVITLKGSRGQNNPGHAIWGFDRKSLFWPERVDSQTKLGHVYL